MAKTKVTVTEFIEKHNPVLTRRGKKMSKGYVYRLIRNHQQGIESRSLWFDYVMEGEKDNIFILVDKKSKK